MANNNIKALLLITLLLCSTLAYAARPEPGFFTKISANTEPGVAVEAEQVEVADIESCAGVQEEECLMRRTLAAHTDYIYTQKHKP
ncbi:Phytosulfokines 2 [Morus notabilis]|uniref:Phytosulfokine n=1 Tax=Morus notabilis TaxID=981085 RepID=W9RVK0_9ROSA|nr:phytosulfokines 3 [Morus notabilis]EXC12624.1 Phytosulfokines 2 [Morus notabilis]